MSRANIFINWLTKPKRMFNSNKARLSKEFKGIWLDIDGELFNAIQEISQKDTIIKKLKTEIFELNRIQEENSYIVRHLNRKNRRFQEDIKILVTELCEANNKYAVQERVMKNMKYDLSVYYEKLSESREATINYKSKIADLHAQTIDDQKRIEALTVIKNHCKLFLEYHKDCDEVKAKLEDLNKKLSEKLAYTNAFLKNQNENLKRDQRLQYLNSMRANNETKMRYEKELAALKQEITTSKRCDLKVGEDEALLGNRQLNLDEDTNTFEQEKKNDEDKMLSISNKILSCEYEFRKLNDNFQNRDIFGVEISREPKSDELNSVRSLPPYYERTAPILQVEPLCKCLSLPEFVDTTKMTRDSCSSAGIGKIFPLNDDTKQVFDDNLVDVKEDNDNSSSAARASQNQSLLEPARNSSSSHIHMGKTTGDVS